MSQKMYWNRPCTCSAHCPILNISVVWHSLFEFYLLLSVISRTWKNTPLSDVTQWPTPELAQAGMWRHSAKSCPESQLQEKGNQGPDCKTVCMFCGHVSSTTQTTPRCANECKLETKGNFKKMTSSENIVLHAGQAEKKETIKIT